MYKRQSLIKVTTYLKKYSVKADYTITMTYRNGNEANDREVKFKGSWYGICLLYTSPKKLGFCP